MGYSVVFPPALEQISISSAECQKEKSEIKAGLVDMQSSMHLESDMHILIFYFKLRHHI